MAVLFFSLLFTLSSFAEKEEVYIKCKECVNYNCPPDTKTPKGFCFRLYLEYYCHEECAGTDWTGAGVSCSGEPIPKPYFVGKIPTTCTTTSTLTSTGTGSGTGTQSSTSTNTGSLDPPESPPPATSTEGAATKKAAQIEMETARQETAILKQTVVEIKNENQKSAQFYAEKKKDLELGKPLTEVLSATYDQRGILAKKGSKGISGAGNDTLDSGSQSLGSAGEKNPEEKSSSDKIDSRIGDSTSASKKGTKGTSPLDKMKALELLRERLKKLMAENTPGAKTEALEIQKLMDMIEDGQIPQLEEEKLLAYLGSKPEFHLDEQETRLAIRELIGDLESAHLPETDLFTRVKEYYRDAFRQGKVKRKR